MDTRSRYKLIFKISSLGLLFIFIFIQSEIVWALNIKPKDSLNLPQSKRKPLYYSQTVSPKPSISNSRFSSVPVQPKPNLSLSPAKIQPKISSSWVTPVKIQPRPNLFSSPVKTQPKPSQWVSSFTAQPQPSQWTSPLKTEPKPNRGSLSTEKESDIKVVSSILTDTVALSQNLADRVVRVFKTAGRWVKDTAKSVIKTCGSFALSAYLSLLGRPVNQEEIAVTTGLIDGLPSDDSTSLYALIETAAQEDVQLYAVKTDYEGLEEIEEPVIARLESESGQGHYLVVTEAKENEVSVIDNEAEETLSKDEFTSEWDGNILTTREPSEGNFELLTVEETKGITGSSYGDDYYGYDDGYGDYDYGLGDYGDNFYDYDLSGDIWDPDPGLPPGHSDNLAYLGGDLTGYSCYDNGNNKGLSHLPSGFSNPGDVGPVFYQPFEIDESLGRLEYDPIYHGDGTTSSRTTDFFEDTIKIETQQTSTGKTVATMVLENNNVAGEDGPVVVTLSGANTEKPGQPSSNSSLALAALREESQNAGANTADYKYNISAPAELLADVFNRNCEELALPESNSLTVVPYSYGNRIFERAALESDQYQEADVIMIAPQQFGSGYAWNASSPSAQWVGDLLGLKEYMPIAAEMDPASKELITNWPEFTGKVGSLTVLVAEGDHTSPSRPIIEGLTSTPQNPAAVERYDKYQNFLKNDYVTVITGLPGNEHVTILDSPQLWNVVIGSIPE